MTRKEEIEKGLKYFQDNPHRMSSLYREMYLEDICISCPGKNLQAGYEMMYRDRDKVFPTIPMKRGKIIDTHMWDESLGFEKNHYTFHNTTDELARRFIEIGYSDYFIL